MEYKQEIADKIWTIEHNIPVEPHIQCWVDVDGTPTKILPSEIVEVLPGTTQVTFLRPYSGIAIIDPLHTWK